MARDAFPRGHVRRDRSGSDARIVDLAATQWWVVDRFELADLGVHRQVVRRRVDSGLLHPLYRGTYAVGRPDPPWQGRYRAAARSCGRHAVVGLVAAGRTLGVLKGAPMRIDVLTTSRGLTGRDGIRIHLVERLAAEEVCELDGIPVTTLARTALDLAREGDLVRLRRLLRAAEQQRLDATGLRALAGGRRAGAPALRATMATTDAGVVLESTFEEEFHAALAGSGLPAASFNHPVIAGNRRVVTVRVTPRRLRTDPGRLFTTLAELIARRSIPDRSLGT